MLVRISLFKMNMKQVAFRAMEIKATAKVKSPLTKKIQMLEITANSHSKLKLLQLWKKAKIEWVWVLSLLKISDKLLYSKDFQLCCKHQRTIKQVRNLEKPSHQEVKILSRTEQIIWKKWALGYLRYFKMSKYSVSQWYLRIMRDLMSITLLALCHRVRLKLSRILELRLRIFIIKIALHRI